MVGAALRAAGAWLWAMLDAEDLVLGAGLICLAWGVAQWHSAALAAMIVGGVLVALVVVRLVLSVWIDIAAHRSGGRAQGGG